MTDEKALDNYVCEGQMSLSDYYPEAEPSIVAVSKIFARAIKNMSSAEWKTFIYTLTKIRWTEGKNSNIVYLDKKTLAKLIGLNSDPDHLSVNLNRSIGMLPPHSYIHFAQEDKEFYDNGQIITRVTLLKNRVRVKIEEEYMSLFEELNKEKSYITMWSLDLFSMNSERSILFYEDLRLHSDTRTTNSKIYSTKELKELFNIPKDGKGSYMKENGHFNRYMFEAKVLVPLVEDLKKCQMINLCTYPDGGYWKKVKVHGKVVGYEFSWDVSTHPRVATASEVKQLNQDPKTLKVAKDIAEGKKKPKQKKRNDFNGFQQNEYNFEELEEQLLNN